MSVSITNQRAALVDANGIVENVIVWDETCVAPANLTAIVLGTTEFVSIGWKHNGDNTFTDPNPQILVVDTPVIAQPSLAELQAQLAQLQQQITTLANQGAT